MSPQSTQNINLTWKANDGGTYYIRNIGKDVWWLGTSGNDDGKTLFMALNLLQESNLEIDKKIVTD